MTRTRFLLYAAAAGMEACWLWAALDYLIRRVGGGSLSPLSILGFYPLAYLFHRMLRKFKGRRALLWSFPAWAALVVLLAKIEFFGGQGWWDPEWLRAFGKALARMFHSFTPEALAVMSSAVLWGFGWRLAAVRIRFSTLVSEFQFGLAILLIVFFLESLGDTKSVLLIPLTLVFFLFALSGIAVSHALEQESWLSARRKNPWFAFLLISIGIILMAGWLISVWVTAPVVEALLSLMTAAGEWILEGIRRLFLLLSSLFPSPKPGELPPPTPLPSKKRPDEFPFQIFSESVREVIRFIWAMVWVFLILLALWRVSSQIFEWLRRKWGGRQEAEVEPMAGSFREDLLRLLRSLFRIFGMKWPFRRGSRAEPFLPGAELVRKTYRQLSAWAAKKGHARNPAHTPYEFLQGLTQWLPERQGDLTAITEQYVRTRYGLSVPTENGLEELRQSWQRVRQTRFKKGAKK